MNPLIPLAIIGVGTVAVVSTAEASVPLSSDGDISDDPFPIDHSADDSTPIINYGSDMSGNIDAFLAVIREGESSNNYSALVGGGSFTDFSHHPATAPITFKGVGNSHAAGAYQFQPGTWTGVASRIGAIDFGKYWQDQGAIELLRERGAYDDIANGDIASAVGKLKSEWQMFTQSKWSVNTVVAHFGEYGGSVA